MQQSQNSRRGFFFGTMTQLNWNSTPPSLTSSSPLRFSNDSNKTWVQQNKSFILLLYCTKGNSNLLYYKTRESVVEEVVVVAVVVVLRILKIPAGE